MNQFPKIPQVTKLELPKASSYTFPIVFNEAQIRKRNQMLGKGIGQVNYIQKGI